MGVLYAGASIDATRTSFSLSACDVLGEDGAAQPEIRIVGKRNSLVFVLHTEQQRHGSEELFPEGRISWLDIGEDGRLHERARPVNSLAAHYKRGPARNGALHLTEKLEQCCFRR